MSKGRERLSILIQVCLLLSAPLLAQSDRARTSVRVENLRVGPDGIEVSFAGFSEPFRTINIVFLRTDAPQRRFAIARAVGGQPVVIAETPDPSGGFRGRAMVSRRFDADLGRLLLIVCASNSRSPGDTQAGRLGYLPWNQAQSLNDALRILEEFDWRVTGYTSANLPPF
jgi:hypothetical protein